MTNEERKEARYHRRQAKRKANRATRSEECGSLDDIFSFHNLFKYGLKCCNGVRWKQSTQNFERHLLDRTAQRRKEVLSGTWYPGKCSHFTINERGKVREIDAPYINDRHVCKTLVREVIVPLYTPVMIMDSGACQTGKGLHWQMERLKEHLRWHYRRYGRKGGVLLMDLKGFFPNANRELVYKRHADLITDPDVRVVADAVIRGAPETSPGKGLPLGTEISQIEMCALPSPVDHWLRCQRGIRTMGHYMDDYYVIMPDIDALEEVRDEMIRRFETLGIPVSTHKTRIVPLTKPFRFCKAKFRLTETGRVIVNGCRDGMKRARRKLRLFASQGRKEAAREYLTSQTAYYANFNDHGRVLRLNRMYHALFSEEENDR